MRGVYLMYQFPDGLYTDVRMEEVYTNKITYQNYELSQNQTKLEKGVMIRIFDGNRWYYSSITEFDKIQAAIDDLAKMATPNPDILNHPVVKRFEVNQDTKLRYNKNCVMDVPNEEKLQLLRSYMDVIKEFDCIPMNRSYYTDTYVKKQIISCLGTDVTFDYQNASVAFTITVKVNEHPLSNLYNSYSDTVQELIGLESKAREFIEKNIDYAKHAVPVEPGTYTCILSPEVAGVFAHESFGHKSEADFMLGDETMKREWAIGSRVGSDILNIVDDGNVDGSGYVPYDDEGCKAKKTYLVKNGVLTGRLHSAYTAADLDEEVTSNARAINFEYEPIVRMTSTYIGEGNLSKEELFAGVTDGIYLEDYSHGSGMTVFTIAPILAYRIRDGKIAEPLKISVITGNVMETLYQIDGLSNELKICSSARGGCGKMEQFPLRVSDGGPYVRVKGIKVQ